MTKLNDYRFLLLNGPPGCGKDTIADRLIANHLGGMVHEKLTRHIRDYLCAVYGFTYDQIERHKDVPMPSLNGHTIREVMIHFTEHHMEPLFGRGASTELLERRIKKQSKRIIVVSDFGYTQDLTKLLEMLESSALMIINIWAADKTFEHDAREYIRHAQVSDAQVTNEWGRPDKIVTEIESLIAPWLNGG